MALDAAITGFSNGFGSTAACVGTLIALGAMFGLIGDGDADLGRRADLRAAAGAGGLTPAGRARKRVLWHSFPRTAVTFRGR
jgi:hypothetical protein